MRTFIDYVQKTHGVDLSEGIGDLASNFIDKRAGQATDTHQRATQNVADLQNKQQNQTLMSGRPSMDPKRAMANAATRKGYEDMKAGAMGTDPNAQKQAYDKFKSGGEEDAEAEERQKAYIAQMKQRGQKTM